MKSKIHYSQPSITAKEIALATDAAANGWGPRCYDYLERFEKEFAAHLGVRHAIATSSCTGALHMGLYALGIGPGDEVILPDISWIASASPIVLLGAKPVFVDILPDTWCIDPAAVEAAITPRTKAIMGVHLYGGLCDMAALLAIGKKHNLPVIEDAAEAIGAIYHGKKAGSMGAFGTFSFHGTKTLTTGEGGMFTTNDSALYEKMLTLSNHGRVRGQQKQFWPEEIGFKYKMSNMQAAIGCAQLERVEELIAKKRHIFAAYQNGLNGLPITMNVEPTGTRNGYWMPSIVVDKGIPFDREKLLAAFKADNIDGRVFFWPLSSLPMFTPQRYNKISYDLPYRACNLPSYHDLTDEEIERVCTVVRQQLAA